MEFVEVFQTFSAVLRGSLLNFVHEFEAFTENSLSKFNIPVSLFLHVSLLILNMHIIR